MSQGKLKFIDLFAGGGGFSYGFKAFTPDGENYPYEFAGAIEFDKGAAETLKSALVRQGYSEDKADSLVVCGDITLSETKNKLYAVCKEVDVIIGGPPCQSFSLIGPRSGDKAKKARFANDSRDNLFEHYIEIVSHYKPIFVMMENVKGILSKKDYNGIPVITKITNALNKLGYNVNLEGQDNPYIILNAADYGVPQTRERVFIIGNRLGVPGPVPMPTHSENGVNGKLPHVTLEDAIGDLPPLQARITYTGREKGVDLSKDPVQRARIDKMNQKRFSGEDPMSYHTNLVENHYASGSQARKDFLNYITTPRPPQLTGHIARSQQESDIELFTKMQPGTTSKHLFRSGSELLTLIKYKMEEHSFIDKYGKLSWDKPSKTLFAHLQKDGNRFIHPDCQQARTITVREAARLQSFPDHYVFQGIGNIRFRYIGNAVPPLLARALAKAIYFKIKNHKDFKLGE